MSNLYMPVDRATIALEAAKMLLEIKAVHFYSDKPFIFTSGWASPVYIDCRKIISFPRLRSSLIDFAATPDGTRVRWSCDVRPHGALRLLGPLLGIVARRQTTAVWEALRATLERPPVAEDAARSG